MAKKKSGGKGSGTHTARKNKYARGSVGASIKGKNRKKTGGIATQKNKSRRRAKHAQNVAKVLERKKQCSEMIDKVRQKFLKERMPEIRKRFGTLNIRRMTDILSDNFEQAPWYLARIARRQAQAERARMVRKHVKFRKRTRAEKRAVQRDKVRDVSQGSDE